MKSSTRQLVIVTQHRERWPSLDKHTVCYYGNHSNTNISGNWLGERNIHHSLIERYTVRCYCNHSSTNISGNGLRERLIHHSLKQSLIERYTVSRYCKPLDHQYHQANWSTDTIYNYHTNRQMRISSYTYIPANDGWRNKVGLNVFNTLGFPCDTINSISLSISIALSIDRHYVHDPHITLTLTYR